MWLYMLGVYFSGWLSSLLRDRHALCRNVRRAKLEQTAALVSGTRGNVVLIDGYKFQRRRMEIGGPKVVFT